MTGRTARVWEKAGQLRAIVRPKQRIQLRLGVVRSGSWLLQNPHSRFRCDRSVHALEKDRYRLAVTFAPEAFDSEGSYKNSGDRCPLDRRVHGARHAPPLQRSRNLLRRAISGGSGRSIRDRGRRRTRSQTLRRRRAHSSHSDWRLGCQRRQLHPRLRLRRS